MTVHAPQIPCSHPTCVPVSPRSSRKKSTSKRRGSAQPSRACPFTVMRIFLGSAMGIFPLARPLDRALERPSRQHARQMAAVLDGGVQVRAGIDQLGGASGRVIYISIINAAVLEDSFRATETYRRRTGPARGQTRRAESIAVDRDHRCNPDYREITVA